MNIDQYMTERVDDQLAYYANRASYFKKHHMRIQVAIIILGVIVPVVINLPMQSYFPNADVDSHLQVGVTGLSLLLAILTGIAGFKQYGERWIQFRSTEEKLKREKYLYLAKAGKYKGAEDAVQKFVEHIENILQSEVDAFEDMIQSQLQGTKQSNEESGQQSMEGTEDDAPLGG